MNDHAPINPYEPPQGPLEAAGAVHEGYVGAWRDGEFLVLKMDRPRVLPQRCVVSGVDVPAKSKIRMEVCFPERSIFQKSLTLRWPVDRKTVAAVRPIDVLTWSLIFAAVVLCVAHWMAQGLPSEYRLPQSVVAFWSLFLLAALFLRQIFVRRFLTLARIQGQHAWVVGVHPRFLEPLSPWPGEPHE